MTDQLNLPPKVYPGMSVLVQARQPQPGNAALERPVRMPVRDPQLCYPVTLDERSYLGDAEPHEATICPRCLISWAREYYITTGEGPSDFPEFRETR